MLLQDYLKAGAIRLGLKSATKEQVLADLVAVLVEAGTIADGPELLATLMEREGLGSTGIGHGVAIPHGRSKELAGPALALGRSETAIDFDSIDGEPARLFFLLVAPENGGNDHLHLLAKIARLVKDAKARTTLLELETPAQVAEWIARVEQP